MLRLLCPNCGQTFDDDMPTLSDGAFFVCPGCDAEITVTFTWKGPEVEAPPAQAPPAAA
jgi:uncharacterized paraquat-inducible protein A